MEPRYLVEEKNVTETSYESWKHFSKGVETKTEALNLKAFLEATGIPAMILVYIGDGSDGISRYQQLPEA